ncbi:MAG: glutamate racemase [Clostridia bacterium]|nr:glutamate racemase [Clostridia bacterium]
MDIRPIGVFDSGLGGLSAVRQLKALLPGEDIVYFGDTARVPYGTRSPETIERYARQDCRFLLDRGVKCIIAACGTVSSVATAALTDLPIPAIGVVAPTGDAALAATHSGRIGLLGTTNTVRSGAFHRYLAQKNPDVQVFAQACPLFVSLVESGWIGQDNEATVAVARRYLRPLIEQQVDTVILGCTHFPLLAPVIRDILGEGVTLIDSGAACAARCRDLLTGMDALNGRDVGGQCSFFVSDHPHDFEAVASMFLGSPVGDNIQQIDPESLVL